MKKLNLWMMAVAVLGMAGLSACTTGKTEQTEQTGTDSVNVSVETDASVKELELVKVLEDGPVSLSIPQDWEGKVKDHSIEVMKLMPENRSRKLVFLEVMVYQQSMAEYATQSGLTEEMRLGEFDFGENHWVVYDKSERGYPAVYLTEFGKNGSFLCVRASGIEVMGVGNPEVEQVLESVKIKEK